MAEDVVSSLTGGVVSLVLNKLGDALIQEAVSLYGVRPEVDRLVRELGWMESFLKDADTKRGKGGELARNWVREVRDLAYQAEDLIDTFMLEVVTRRRRRGSGPMGRIKRYAAFPFAPIIARHKVAAGLKEVKAKIAEIRASRENYGVVIINPAGETTGQTSSSAAAAATANYNDSSQPTIRKRIIPYRDDDDDDDNDKLVVGFNPHKDKILVTLLDTNITRRCVISVVGIGGLGKTTLANKVFKNIKVRSRFNTYACISVSQDYRIREMLNGIAKQVMGASTSELQSLDIDELKEKIYKFLKGKRYFIVLDDVWGTDVWAQTREALPDDKNGSRVMVTTRSMEVAKSADPVIPPYRLPFLNEEESWELFLKKAFDVAPASVTKELEVVGRQLVTRCRGLPLALIVLGGVVWRKGPNPAAWRRVAERLDWASTHEGGGSLKILGLSYDDLPHHHLRLCFLYLGAFPEDSMMAASTVSRLWIAEGFIPTSETQTMEDTAQAYLDELARRSMIQAFDVDDDGCVGSFRIHDLFRDLCLREAREDGFLHLYSAYSSDQQEVMRRDHITPRRLAVHSLTSGDQVKQQTTSGLRSLLVYHSRLTSSHEIFNGLKLLRVIILDDISSLERIPEEITSMIHLRFLRVYFCWNVKEIPESIGNLSNLQTFVVGLTGIKSIPKSLGKIQALRHLHLFNGDCPPLGNLTNLQTLWCYGVGGWIESGFGHLLNMRDLIMSKLKATQGEAFLGSIRQLKHLSSLMLWEAESILPAFITCLSSNNHLRQLRLEGPMLRSRQLPTIHGFPPNLNRLCLGRSKLVQDPMATLEKLQSLVSLELYNDAYVGEVMVCTACGFPQLRSLDLRGLPRLEEWRVDAGAMPSLASLTINKCTGLRMLPGGLKHVTSLQSLTVYDEREDFRGRLQRDAGVDWCNIQHIRSIIVTK